MHARKQIMSSRKTRFAIATLTLVTLSLACSHQKPAPFEPENTSVRSDREAPFNPPERYPEWAFDQPEYVKPAAPDQHEPIAQPNDPRHFFTNKRIVMVEQPTGYTPEETPRIAVYYTDDNGFHWHKAGYFGREQSYFPLETDEDGDYGVNFVGPGQKPEEHTPAYPERMYHVDTMLPEVMVNIDPEKTWYDVGETIRISWEAKDPHLEQFPVRIGMLMDFTASEHDLIELQRDLPDEGSIDYRISSETEGHEIVFRIEALDRASNLGLAYSHALQIKDHADEQILSKNARHHDDRIRTARRSTPKSTSPTPVKPTLAVTKPAPSAPSTMTETSAANNDKPLTRVKVVTINQPAPAAPKNDAEPMTTTPAKSMGASENKPTPMSSATPRNDDITPLLDCDEREAYEKTIASSPEPEEPVAAASPKSDTATAPVKSMTIQEALATLKEDISHYANFRRPAAPKNEAKETTVTLTKSKPAPAPKTDVAPAKPSVVSRSARTPKPTSSVATARPMNAATADAAPGAGLVAPMPGVVPGRSSGAATSHPWRSLGAGSATANAQTWALPDAKTAVSARPTDIPTIAPNGPVLVEVREADELPAN